MNTSLLREHIANYLGNLQKDQKKHDDDLRERTERKAFFQGWSVDRMRTMSEEDIYGYFSQLWAMRIWSNKRYVIEKMIRENGFEKLKAELANLVWGRDAVEARWNGFRKSIRHIGPAMMSELLCHVHPDTCMLWNRRAYVAYRYLNITAIPRYDYQLTGRKYEELSANGREIAREMRALGANDVELLIVDYFLWDELQVEHTLSQIHKKAAKTTAEQEDIAEIEEVEKLDAETSQFVHNETKYKLAEIGQWLGFSADTEVKVADGSVVDTVWEATIGNMGRVIYVFEVQTKGSIDSLILNLFKSMSNPAVQGVVAVSDSAQLGKIQKHASAVKGLGDKLKYWDYKEVLKVHEALQGIHEVINKLGLVPQGF